MAATIIFFISFYLVSIPSILIWETESIPIKIRAVLVTAISFVLGLVVISRFLKELGMSYKEIGVKWSGKRDFARNLSLLLSGVAACLMWVFVYFSSFKLLFPAQYSKLEAMKYNGYINFLSEWGGSGEFFGVTSLWCSVLLLATIEELAFRGLIFTYIRRKYSFKKALLWSSTLFTLGHLNPYNFPVSFMLGLIFALLYVKSSGIVVPILAHFCYNLSLHYFSTLFH
ncbi:MAG: CPBP family intramembrane metalloprotease [Elusimicrobia bacterium]|nr:CPBP family intramembrane metalloprotease [Elusimicrobiota bacterium]